MKNKYILLNWLNKPSTNTPINANNLNHIDNYLNYLSENAAENDDIPKNLSQLTNDKSFLTKDEVITLINSSISSLGTILVFKGIVDTYSSLSSVERPINGWVYKVTDDSDSPTPHGINSEYYYNGTAWEYFSSDVVVELDDYFTKEEIVSLLSSYVLGNDIKGIKSTNNGILYTVDGVNWIEVKHGENGATFVPSVDEEGNISWENDKNLPNPSTVNIKGPKGDKGYSPTIEVYESTSTSYVLKVNNENSTCLTPNLKGKDGLGSGDMSKSDYDTNSDGIVNQADKVTNALNITINGETTSFDGSEPKNVEFSLPSGTMTKDVYDKDNDGIVDNANALGGQSPEYYAKQSDMTKAQTDIVNNSKEVCVNLLNPTLQTTTQYGVTCTNNGDGTYTLNGTSTNGYSFVLNILYGYNYNGYKLVGCPTNVPSGVKIYSKEGNESFATITEVADNGLGAFLTNCYEHKVNIYVPSGVTCNNLVFKPMITPNLNATYDDFIPYTGNGKKLNECVSEIVDSYYNLGAPTQTIPSGADLNEYITDGIYSSNTSAVNLLNCPTTSTAWVNLVVRHSIDKYVIQELVLINYDSQKWTRECCNGTWGKWRETAYTDNISNPNLLINGGMDINQRSTSAYTVTITNQYVCDGWKITNTNGSATWNVDGSVSITSTAGLTGVAQYFENYVEYGKHTLTFSCDVNGVRYSVTTEKGATQTLSIYNDDGIIIARLSLVNSGTSTARIVLVSDTGYTNTFDNAKLEIGTVATPYSPRPYGEELALCQRYFVNLMMGNNGYGFIGKGFAKDTSLAYVFIDLPTSIRDCQSLSLIKNGNFRLFNTALNNNITVTDIKLNVINNTSTKIMLVVYASGLTAGSEYSLTANNDNTAYLLLSSEL